MSEIVDIKEAREIMIKSQAFSEAIKKINDAILSASDCGAAKAEVIFYAKEMMTYEAVASLLEVKGYDVEIVKGLSPDCSIVIGWGFNKREED